MKLKFHPGSVLSFIVLSLLLHEAHEMAHYAAASVLCGMHGARLDMLTWVLPATCHSESAFVLATLAGPFITYVFMWSGFFLLAPKNPVRKKYVGFALIAGSLPFPKLLAMLDHGGDEITATRVIHQAHENFNGEAIIIGAIIILALSLPPLWRAWRSIRQPHSLWIFLTILLVSAQLDELIYGAFMNNFLAHHGILMKPVFGGLPLLVIVWDLFLVVAFLLTRKQLQFSIVKEG